ncbi:hypothetical protein PVAP13_7NG086967 [Panicum virgatum]|uniref:Uncharacterized protein n=1 Tax=Panicum virgatum TaxID=38727 RepID=A0A8T0PU89_PANVG|nr:hypothetical protein PVAP13_7NG086967 [Panicum virgatum]
MGFMGLVLAPTGSGSRGIAASPFGLPPSARTATSPRAAPCAGTPAAGTRRPQGSRRRPQAPPGSCSRRRTCPWWWRRPLQKALPFLRRCQSLLPELYVVHFRGRLSRLLRRLRRPRVGAALGTPPRHILPGPRR